MNTRLASTLLLALCAVPACGPSGGSDDAIDAPASDGVLPPIRIPGGGVTSAPIDGVVNVYVVEPGTATPIAGAAVHLGGAGGALQLDATTDPDGLAVFRDAGIAGAQTITATASGRTAATWIGVAGGNVTIPLAPRVTPSAHVSGTIAGWGNLPSPSFGHYTLAVITTSFTRNFGGPENRLTQATSGGTPVNTCINDGSGGACAWQLTARTGPQIHTAVIVDGDSQLTSSTADDTYDLIGYAVGSPMTLGAGQQVNGESLTIVSAALTGFTARFPAAAPGLGRAVAIPMLDTGANGMIPMPLPTLTASNATTQVLPPSGAPGGNYRLVGLATPSATAAAPFSSSFAAVTNLGSATLPAWLPAPTGITSGGGSIGFTAPAGTSLAFANLSSGGTAAWTITVLDGATSFRLPPISPDPLSGGTITLDVTAAEAPGFTPTMFLIDDVTAALTRASGASATFSR
ncbi:MAG: hypothetical protein JNK64_08030 [Myxococcales bacterium]|nr:hypothetical protein [Myxococcales bacterium]